MIKRIRRAIWHKNFTPDQLRRYVGEFEGCYFTYAADDAVRTNAASGGSVSALLIYLLENGQIDGALVCQTVLHDGKPRPEFAIARTREEIMAAQGSKYAAVYFSNDAMPLIKAIDSRLSVLALPCDATILQRARAKNPALDAKIPGDHPVLRAQLRSRCSLTRWWTGWAGRGPLTAYRWRTGIGAAAWKRRSPTGRRSSSR